MPTGALHYAIKWPIAEGKNVYRAGENSIPIPYVSTVLGLCIGTIYATLLLLFVGWAKGVGNYARHRWQARATS